MSGPGSSARRGRRRTIPTARLWGPFFAHTVLVQAITFVLRPTAVYKAIELGVPTYWLGAIGASFALLPLLLAVPTGQFSDRFGERTVMILGSVLTLAGAAVFTVLGSNVAGLLAASMLLGTGHLASVVGQQAHVATVSAVDRYDTAFGRYTFATSAGQAVGPGLIVGFGGSQAIPNTQSIFQATVALAAGLLLAALLLPRPAAHRGGPRPNADEPASMRTLLRRPGLVRALTVSCVVLAAVDICLVYLPALGTERGISAGTVGVILAIRAAASMLCRLFLGRLSQWLGRRTLLTGSVAISAIAMALVPVPAPVWVLCVLVALTGLGLGAGQPLTMSWLAESTPPGLLGRAMSLRLTGNRLGQVVVPSVAGLVAVGAGAAGVLWVTAAALAGVGVLSRHIAGTRSAEST